MKSEYRKIVFSIRVSEDRVSGLKSLFLSTVMQCLCTSVFLSGRDSLVPCFIETFYELLNKTIQLKPSEECFAHDDVLKKM